MADDVRTHRVTVKLHRGYEFVATFDDVEGAPEMRLDEPRPLGEGGAPCATDVLSAAVANCLSASLAFCLRRARIEVKGIEARVTTRVARNDKGRYRIEGIDVELSHEVVDPEGRRARCLEIFEDFCTVTASIRQGIPVTVSVKRKDEGGLSTLDSRLSEVGAPVRA
jgi:uncharacterized OsmC-like protein